MSRSSSTTSIRYSLALIIWQPHFKNCSSSGFIAYFNITLITFDNIITYRQSQASAFFLGSKERIEDLLHMLQRDAWSCIRKGYLHIPFKPFCFYIERSVAGHGISCIKDNIHKHLYGLRFVDRDPGQFLGDIKIDWYIFHPLVILYQVKSQHNEVPDIEWLKVSNSCFREAGHLSDDICYPVYMFCYGIKTLICEFVMLHLPEYLNIGRY